MSRIEPITSRGDAADGGETTAAAEGRGGTVLRLVLKTLIPIVLVAAAAYGYWQITATTPPPERAERPRLPRLVETVEARPATRGPRLEAWGDVASVRRLQLRAEVAGRVSKLHPHLVTGGEVEAGTLLFAVDDRGARHRLAEAEAQIAQIDARILVERGQAARAALDLQRLPDPSRLTDVQRALILRAPQMAELEAERAAARATRDMAGFELEKTEMHAPFDALVLSADIAPGARLGAGTEVAELVPLDRFEVHLAMPLSAIEWLEVGAGREVTLSQPGVWPEGVTRTGRIDRVAPSLNPAARMAEVIVTVEDPLARKAENIGKPALILGSFLRADLEGRRLEGATAIDRAHLRDGDTVWIMTPEDRLEIRPLEIAWRGARDVLVTGGLAPGERVVTTTLASVAEGMLLRVRDPAEAASGPGSAGAPE